MFLIPWGISDDELNYSTLTSVKGETRFKDIHPCSGQKLHEDVQKESRGLSDTAGLCREQPFVLY